MEKHHGFPNTNDQKFFIDMVNVLEEILSELQEIRATLSSAQTVQKEVKPKAPRKPRASAKKTVRARKSKTEIENKKVDSDVYNLEGTAEGPYIP